LEDLEVQQQPKPPQLLQHLEALEVVAH